MKYNEGCSLSGNKIGQWQIPLMNLMTLIGLHRHGYPSSCTTTNRLLAIGCVWFLFLFNKSELPLYTCILWASALTYCHRYRKRKNGQPGCLHIRILASHNHRLTEARVQLGFRFSCDICAIAHFSPKTHILPKNFRWLRSQFYLQ